MQRVAKTNLQPGSDTGQAFSDATGRQISGSDAARSVQSLGTTAPDAESLGKSGGPEWQEDLEYVWRVRTADAMANLNKRARRYRRIVRNPDRCPATAPRLRVALLRAAEWAEHRARALAMSRADVVAACGVRWRAVTCGCGRVEMRVGCDQPQLCSTCRKRHSRKWRARITAGMDRALSDERREWYRTPRALRRGMLPGIYLITLTAPHASGDIEVDRETMGVAVRKLLKHANKKQWWRTYALTWEVTCGPTKLAPNRSPNEAHLHCHLAVISSWIPYNAQAVAAIDPDAAEALSLAMAPRGRGRPRPSTRELRSIRGLHDVWRDAMDGALVLDVKAPKRGADNARTAGEYLAKYVTKGVDPSEFTGRKAGELLVAFRCRRKVSTSAGFWTPTDCACDRCHEAWRSTGAPCSLQDIAPGAVLRSQSVRYRFARWSQDELFAPWEWRAPNRPPEPPRERKSKLNAPSRWKLYRS
jgi:hypothetical protein